ncbi:sialidase family protein [Oscillatoria laete-virens NRMC-F 0139]|nr:sialidase family protein [Oscillatoria laete-virens]MDL5054140.1 sialidase family protein [Oscillatoria laete-virens NRMC-F 0139]
MGSNFDSFEQSKLDGFVESSLHERNGAIKGFYAGFLGLNNYRAAWSKEALAGTWNYTPNSFDQFNRFMLGNIGNKVLTGRGYWNPSLATFASYTSLGGLNYITDYPVRATNGNYIAMAIAGIADFRQALSTDGGLSWSPITFPGTPSFLNCRALVKPDGRIILGGNNGGRPCIWRSDDHGLTWVVKNTSASGIFSIIAAATYYKGNRLWLLYEHGSAPYTVTRFHSDNDGDTWTFVGSTGGHGQFGIAHVMPTGRVYFLGRAVISPMQGFTDNDGATTSPPNNGGLPAGGAFIDKSNVIWRIMTPFGSSAFVQRSFDEGRSFSFYQSFDTVESQCGNFFQANNYRVG